MRRNTLQLVTASFLVGLALSAPALAQEAQESTTPLDRANQTFKAADKNNDGTLDLQEVAQAQIPRSVVQTWDKDKSRGLSRDEFLGYYRQLMVNAGKPTGADLDAKVKRIEAARKAQQDREARRRAQAANQQSGSDATSGDANASESTADKYKRAQAALNDRLSRAKASRETASKEQAKLTDRARNAGVQGATAGASGADAQETDAQETVKTVRERLARAEAALAKRAGKGDMTREQYDALQEKLADRARGVSAGSGTETSDLSGVPAAARQKLERAFVALEKRAAAGNWSREKLAQEKQELTKRARDAEADKPTGAETEGLTPLERRQREARRRAAEAQKAAAEAKQRAERAAAARQRAAEAKRQSDAAARQRAQAQQADAAARKRAAEARERAKQKPAAKPAAKPAPKPVKDKRTKQKPVKLKRTEP